MCAHTHNTHTWTYIHGCTDTHKHTRKDTDSCENLGLHVSDNVAVTDVLIHVLEQRTYYHLVQWLSVGPATVTTSMIVSCWRAITDKPYKYTVSLLKVSKWQCPIRVFKFSGHMVLYSARRHTFPDQSALNWWFDQYHVGQHHFPRFFLVPNLNCINMKLRKMFKTNFNVKPGPEYKFASHFATSTPWL